MNLQKLFLFSITILVILLLAGCDPQFGPSGTDSGQAITPSDDGQTIEPPAPTAQQQTAQPTASPAPVQVRELDGNSPGDAPDKFQDGQVELLPGEYTDNALLRNDDFDDKSDDVDNYKFKVAAGDWFKLTLTPVSELDAQILIHDEGGKDKTWDYTYYYIGNPTGQPQFKLNSGIAGKEESFWSQMSTEQDSYNYYFSVMAVKGKGAYTLQLETKKQNDGNAGKDSGEKPAKAISLEAGKEYPGLLNFNDMMDCYKLSVPGRTTVTVTPTEKLDVSFTLHDEGGKDKTWDLTYYKKTDKKTSAFRINDADTGLPESVTWDTTSSTQFVCLKKEKGSGDYTIKYS